jgi:diguanylate cyclase (GGDEF)-like protein
MLYTSESGAILNLDIARPAYLSDIDERFLNCADYVIAEFSNRTLEVGLQLSQESRIAEQERARLDDLTLLYDAGPWKDLLNRTVGSAIASEYTVVVAFIDLDNFKLVNDRIGHATGDKLLISFSSFFRERLREEESIPGRLGGDEFGIFGVLTQRPDLIPTTKEEKYLGYTNHIQQIIDEYFVKLSLSDEEFAINVRHLVPEFNLSVGFASTIEGHINGQSLYEAADAAMYKAKRAKE